MLKITLVYMAAELLWQCIVAWNLTCLWMTPTSSISDVPNNFRADAVQCVLLLLPDEHREALQTLLEFLCQVSARSACNQMTASNLAVCLAPSVFHLHHAPSSLSSSRSSSASPRRRKTVGVPDQRELGENRAAHDCLLYLIKEHKDLFMVCYFHCLVWVASYIPSNWNVDFHLWCKVGTETFGKFGN